jgi:hypothetical protein
VVDGLQFLAGEVIAQHRTPYEAALSIMDRRIENVENQLRAHEVDRDRLQAKLAALKQRLDGRASAKTLTELGNTVTEIQRRGWEADLLGTEGRLAAASQRGLDLQAELVQLAGYRARLENTTVRSAPASSEPVGPRTSLYIARRPAGPDGKRVGRISGRLCEPRAPVEP